MEYRVILLEDLQLGKVIGGLATTEDVRKFDGYVEDCIVSRVFYTNAASPKHAMSVYTDKPILEEAGHASFGLRPLKPSEMRILGAIMANFKTVSHDAVTQVCQSEQALGRHVYKRDLIEAIATAIESEE